MSFLQSVLRPMHAILAVAVIEHVKRTRATDVRFCTSFGSEFAKPSCCCIADCIEHLRSQELASYFFSYLTSHFSPLTSHLSRLTSHVSHCSPFTSYFTFFYLKKNTTTRQVNTFMVYHNLCFETFHGLLSMHLAIPAPVGTCKRHFLHNSWSQNQNAICMAVLRWRLWRSNLSPSLYQVLHGVVLKKIWIHCFSLADELRLV